MADRQKVKLPPGFVLDLDPFDRAQQKLPPEFLLDRFDAANDLAYTTPEGIPVYKPKEKDWTTSMGRVPQPVMGGPVFNPLAPIAKSWESIQSLADLMNPEATWKERAGDARTVLGNTLEQGLPRYLPAVAANPGRHVPSLLLGMGTQNVVDKNLTNWGVDPRVSGLVSDLFGLGVGAETSRLPLERLPQALRDVSLREFMRSELGESRRPAKPYELHPEERDITARDIIRKAADPKKLSYEKFEQMFPDAGDDVFDMSNLQPAIPRNVQAPRYAPAKGTPERVTAAFENPDVAAGLERFMREGQAKMPEHWYRTSPLFQAYVRVFGTPAKAEAPFRQLMNYVASTSAGHRVPPNIRTGTFYNYLATQGLPFPKLTGAKKGLPKGFGHKYWQTHLKSSEKVRAQGGLDPLQQDKEFSFAENLTGNELLLTADRHFMRMLGMLTKDRRFLATKAEDKDFRPRAEFDAGRLTMEEALNHPEYWSSSAAETEYGAIESAVQKIAKGLKVPTASLQGWDWIGAGEGTGLGSKPEPFIRTFAKRVAYTAHQMGVSKEQILDKVIRGKIPLLTLLGGAVLSEEESGQKR